MPLISNLLNGLGLTRHSRLFAKDSAVELTSRLISLGQYFDFIITVGGTGQGKSDLLRKAIKMSGGSSLSRTAPGYPVPFRLYMER